VGDRSRNPVVCWREGPNKLNVIAAVKAAAATGREIAIA
jgi:hypothetical protein